jgi:uncharacterized membrane protein
MENKKMDDGRSMLRLVRFVFFYGLAVVLLLWLLPMAGLFLEHQYEAMTAMAKAFAMLGLLAAIGAWQWLSLRQRWQRAAPADRVR